MKHGRFESSGCVQRELIRTYPKSFDYTPVLGVLAQDFIGRREHFLNPCFSCWSFHDDDDEFGLLRECANEPQGAFLRRTHADNLRQSIAQVFQRFDPVVR
jgi:hypothetical protein